MDPPNSTLHIGNKQATSEPNAQVTYADTRLTGNGEVPVERVLTNATLGP